MAGAIIVFVVAASIGIYTYSRILYANDKILTESEYFDRTAESFSSLMYADDTDRVYTGAEIAMQIINMYEGKDFAYKKITVNGTVFKEPTNPVTEEDFNNTSYKDMNDAIELFTNDLKTSQYVVSSISYDGNKGANVSYSKK